MTPAEIAARLTPAMREQQEGLRGMISRGFLAAAVAVLPECQMRRDLHAIRAAWRDRVRAILAAQEAERNG